MTSTIGVKKVQYPNGTNAITIASDGTLTTDSDFTISGELTVSPSNSDNNIATIKTGSLEARLDFVANRANKINQAIRFAVDSDEKAAFSITAGTDLLARSEGGANQNLDLRQGSAKVWSHNNYSDNSLRDAYNVSSLTDLGTGRYQHNFTNNMNNSNYSGHMSLRNNINQWWVGSYTTTHCSTNSYTGSAYSDQHHKLAVFGDLA